jgi:hypothetical protein
MTTPNPEVAAQNRDEYHAFLGSIVNYEANRVASDGPTHHLAVLVNAVGMANQMAHEDEHRRNVAFATARPVHPYSPVRAADLLSHCSVCGSPDHVMLSERWPERPR